VQKIKKYFHWVVTKTIFSLVCSHKWKLTFFNNKIMILLLLLLCGIQLLLLFCYNYCYIATTVTTRPLLLLLLLLSLPQLLLLLLQCPQRHLLVTTTWPSNITTKSWSKLYITMSIQHTMVINAISKTGGPNHPNCRFQRPSDNNCWSWTTIMSSVFTKPFWLIDVVSFYLCIYYTIL
jgi:hypothetical protein